MQRSNVIILLAVVLAVLEATDLTIALRTGRARGRGGIMTREKRPGKFWRYICGGSAVLLACVGVILWALISPSSF
jgi:hypothetical protein